jgi:hypothetical protein
MMGFYFYIHPNAYYNYSDNDRNKTGCEFTTGISFNI